MELGAIGPAPFAGALLADLGADVVASTGSRARTRLPTCHRGSTSTIVTSDRSRWI